MASLILIHVHDMKLYREHKHQMLRVTASGVL